jgi:hypothetical protein
LHYRLIGLNRNWVTLEALYEGNSGYDYKLEFFAVDVVVVVVGFDCT